MHVPARLALLRLLHLSSPALPIGAFHFSQGLEYAVHAGWVSDEGTALDWIEGLAANALGTLDLPILARLYRCLARRDFDGFERWNALLIALRESEELRAEDRHLGAALMKILGDLQVCEAVPVPSPGRALGHAAAFSLACQHWGIPEAHALQAYAWVWAEGQATAAVKLVPLGQSAGQRVLHALIPKLEALCRRAASMPDDAIGTSAVMQSVASARHERQYTRLFRS